MSDTTNRFSSLRVSPTQRRSRLPSRKSPPALPFKESRRRTPIAPGLTKKKTSPKHRTPVADDKKNLDKLFSRYKSSPVSSPLFPRRRLSSVSWDEFNGPPPPKSGTPGPWVLPPSIAPKPADFSMLENNLNSTDLRTRRMEEKTEAIETQTSKILSSVGDLQALLRDVARQQRQTVQDQSDLRNRLAAIEEQGPSSMLPKKIPDESVGRHKSPTISLQPQTPLELSAVLPSQVELARGRPSSKRKEGDPHFDPDENADDDDVDIDDDVDGAEFPIQASRTQENELPASAQPDEPPVLPQKFSAAQPKIVITTRSANQKTRGRAFDDEAI